MPNHKSNPPAAAHQCPSCHFAQTRIRRVLGNGTFGSGNFVCARRECALGIDVSRLETWVADAAPTGVIAPKG